MSKHWEVRGCRSSLGSQPWELLTAEGYLDGFQALRLMLQVVEAVSAVAVIAELSVGKAVAVTGRQGSSGGAEEAKLPPLRRLGHCTA